MEQWIQDVAAAIVESLGQAPSEALAAARWGQRWLEAYKKLVEGSPPRGKVAVREAMMSTYASSLAESPEVTRYPSGAPTLRAIIAVQEVFCLAFDEEASDVRKLLHEHHTPVGHRGRS